MPVDILAIAAHRDDVELTCAGTLLRAVDAGYRTGILDLTAGESGTHGSAALRAREANEAARILGVVERRNAGLPDAHLHNSEEARRLVVEQIRHFASGYHARNGGGDEMVTDGDLPVIGHETRREVDVRLRRVHLRGVAEAEQAAQVADLLQLQFEDGGGGPVEARNLLPRQPQALHELNVAE